MEIRWLEAFIAVAEELHFSKAATRLNLAQSPLSQTIRRLERDLGTTLFDRNTRSVTLTPAGQALLPYARRVFADIELGRQATRARNGVVHGTVSIGFSGALNHQSLPPLTRAVRSRYPDVTLALTGRGDDPRRRRAVDERGDLDLGVRRPRQGLIEPSPVRSRLDRAGADRGGAADRPSGWPFDPRSTSPTSPMNSSSRFRWERDRRWPSWTSPRRAWTPDFGRGSHRRSATRSMILTPGIGRRGCRPDDLRSSADHAVRRRDGPPSLASRST